MNVIGHQAVSMQLDTALLHVLAQPVEIKPAIFVREKNRLPINATLNDMLWNTGKMNARATRHASAGQRRRAVVKRFGGDVDIARPDDRPVIDTRK